MRYALSLLVVVLATIKRTTSSIANSCSAITPPPKNLICSQNGRFTSRHADNLQSTQVVGADECRDYCLNAFTHDAVQDYRVKPPSTDPANRFKCRFFGHDSVTNTCNLYFNAPIIGDPGFAGRFVADPNSKVTFTAATCYTCTQKCNIPDDVNLLYNPRFNVSSDFLGPWSLTTDLYKYEVAAQVVPAQFVPAQVVPIKGPGNTVLFEGIGGGGISQQVSLCGAQDYIASVDYLITKPNDLNSSTFFSQLGMSIGDCTASISIDATNVEFGKWGTLACSAQNEPQKLSPFPNIADFEIDVLAQPDDVRVYIFNPQLRQISPPRALKTVGKSLLINGGFETGSHKPWVVDAQPKPTYKVNTPGLPPIAGLPASQHKFTFISTGSYDYYYESSNNFISLSQNTTHALEPGELYIFTVEYRQIDTNGISTSVGETFLERTSLRFDPGKVLVDNRTMVLSRIVMGKGKSEEVMIKWDNKIAVGAGKLHTRIEVDNVSIRKLANQKI